MTDNNNDVYARPPGLVGAITQFIHDAAPRPDPVIALAGAIGFVAGIVGRAYNVSNTGLNLNVTCLAATGTGKEAIASGIDALIEAVAIRVPNARYFVGPAEISSAPALHKCLAEWPHCFVSINSESGLQRQQTAKGNTPPYMLDLRRMKLALFNKSGRGQWLRGRVYSNKEQNTPPILAPAYTELGESTPGTWYETISETSIASGDLPRQVVFESRSERPSLNRNRLSGPPEQLVERLASLCSKSLELNHANHVVDVRMSPEAQALMDSFNEHHDERIRSAKDESTRQLSNRAHINALKLAAQIAVGCDWMQPTMTYEHAAWATRIIHHNISNVLARIEQGEVGAQSESEPAQQNKVRRVIHEWIAKQWYELARSYPGIGDEDMWASKVVPYSYISKRLTSDAAFKEARSGATATIKRTIDELCKGGELEKLPLNQTIERFKTRAELYAVKDAKRIGRAV